MARSEVFWSFSPHEPMSTADVARALGKAPSAVRYHVNELVRVRLIIAVEQRKRRSRIEDAYVHAARQSYTAYLPLSEEYIRQLNRGFNAMLRAYGKERSAAIRLANRTADPDAIALHLFENIRLTKEARFALRKRLIDLMEEVSAMDDPEGVRYSVCVYQTLALGESLRRGAEAEDGDEVD